MPRQFTTAITCLVLLVTTSLFLSSCQKEELSNPINSQTATESDRLTGPDLQPTHLGNHHYATVNAKQLNPPLQPPTPSLLQIATVNAKQINIAVHKLVFQSITIDHYAALTHLPDYSISINANGTAAYEGRRNVNVNGSRMLEVSKEQLERINNLCIRLAAIKAESSFANQDSKKLAQPINRTTFRGVGELNFWSQTDNNSQPKWLVTFRAQVEEVLNLSALINIPGQVATVVK